LTVWANAIRALELLRVAQRVLSLSSKLDHFEVRTNTGKTLQPILVIGGTRGTGLLIARLLHWQGYRVRVLARDRERALTLFDPSVQVVEGDLTKPRLLPAGHRALAGRYARGWHPCGA
jgi:NAD(P)-dependent dehydrogenase (short-subunit alcohol dehydrogenase family)